ncbi:MAG TPA: AMP-binding protein [Candidatus Acidoferrales bacterium]
MLEPLVRTNLARLQGIYDRFPPPARNLMTSARGWLLSNIRYSRRTFSYLKSLREHEEWSREDVEAFQLRALQGTVTQAWCSVPYYKDEPFTKISTFDDLRRLPVLERETVRNNHELFLSSEIPAYRRIRAGTTGTTGGNLKVAYTEELASANWAILLRQWAWAGVQPLHPRVSFFGAKIVPTERAEPPYWTVNLTERQTLMSIFHLSARTAADYLKFLRTRADSVLEGFPSVLAILADFVLQAETTIPMHTVFTSGEPLYPWIREKLEAAFQCQVFDSYGMTEYCGAIQQCTAGQMHLIPEFGFLEILDEQNRPVPEGEEGFFVWTGFLNRAMPLVRYRIGDRGRWQEHRTCGCGLNFPLVTPTITRESDILRCTDGRLFSPRALNQILKGGTSLRSCQFIHERPDRVVVRAVPGNSRGAEEMMRIRTKLEQLLGPSMRVTAEIAVGPLTLPGGKIPLIVNQATAKRFAESFRGTGR